MFFKKKKEKIEGPTNYQAWILAFKELKSANNLEERYEYLCSGTLKDSKYSLNYFKNELVEFVQFYLQYILQKYNHDLNHLLPLGDYNSIRFHTQFVFKRIHKLKFYETLKFIEDDFKKQITDEINRNVEEFIKQIKKFLYANSEQSEFFSELAYIIDTNKGCV